ncbi:YitT family protein [Porphyromonadaceae bacterium W3.11]|nr:YitT family protein [Porphyromonadaceae bacterium W3.11]
MENNLKPSKNAFTIENAKKSLLKVLALLKTKKFWVELVIMTVGMFIGAIGVYFFLLPSKLIVGSITGLSIVLAKIFPIMSVGSMIFLLNFILLVLAFVLIGNEFGAKTVYTALILGPMIDFISSIAHLEQSIFAIEVAGETILNPWFDLLCFVVILSASQSVLFSINASTGGLDILAKIINKYTGINIGTAVTVAGGLICCTAFAINDVNLVLIGLIGTWLNGIILNNFMSGMSSKTRVFIISKEYQKIQDFVIHKIGRGVTLHEIIGGYTNEKSVQLEILLARDEFGKLMEFLGKNKIPSFVTTDSVNEVYGLWNKKTKIRV